MNAVDFGNHDKNRKRSKEMKYLMETGFRRLYEGLKIRKN
jgi:hypothetical protein